MKKLFENFLDFFCKKGNFHQNWLDQVLRKVAEFRDINFREWAILDFSRDIFAKKGKIPETRESLSRES